MTSPFGTRHLLRSLPFLKWRGRAGGPGLAPEFDDHELVRIATTNTPPIPDWERRLVLLYNGMRRP